MNKIYFEEQSFEKKFIESKEDCEFVNCFFDSIDFSMQSLKNSVFLECSFARCNLSNAVVVGTAFVDVKFSNCKMVGINWCDCKRMRGLNFFESKLDFSVFQDLIIPHTIIDHCSVRDADFSRSDLKNSQIINSDLLNSLFNECNLEKTDFRFSTNYWLDPRQNKMKEARFSLPEAVTLIEALGIKIG